VVVIVVVLSASVAVCADAYAGDLLPMPVTSTTPASGASVVQGTSTAFKIQTPLGCYIGTMSLKLLALNGTVAYSTTLSGGSSSPYTSYPYPDWVAIPGQYSWSVSCSAYRSGDPLVKDEYVSPAFALTVVEAPIKSLVPDEGARFVQATSMFGQFQLRTDRGDLSCPLSVLSRVEVATQPTLGQDGTLATDFQVGELMVQRSDAFSDLYRDVAGLGRTAYAWQNTPGTYYWQMIICGFKTPVRTLTIVPPAPPTPLPIPKVAVPAASILSSAKAKLVATRELRRRVSWRRGASRKLTCAAAARTVRCDASWRYKQARYRGTVTVAAQSNDRVTLRTVIRRVH
jgi:hypothetical protein